MDQDIRILELDAHLLGIGDEVRAQVAAVELHAFDDFELGFSGLGFFDGDDAFIADLLHCFGEIAADFLVAIGRDSADLGNFRIVGDLASVGLQFLDDRVHGKVDTAFQVHRVHARRDRLGAFLDDRLGKNGRRRRAVAGYVIGLRGNFAQHLRAHILELVFEFDFLGDRNTVLGDARCAEGLVDHDVAAFRAERHLHGVGQNIDPSQHAVTGIDVEFHVFRSHFFNSSIGSYC